LRLLVSIFVCCASFVSFALNENLVQSAEAFYAQNDFPHALDSWKKIYKVNPHSVEAVIRVSDLQLLLDGHESAQKTILEFLSEGREHLSSSQVWIVQQRLLEVQNRFVKDDSQSLYFQAMVKIKLADFNQALPLLNQANQIEKGNSKILESKAQCERELGQYTQYYDTLKTTAELNWINNKVREELLEAQYFFRDFSDIIQWSQSQINSNMSLRQKTVISLAKLEKAENQDSVRAFLQIIEGAKGRPVNPMIWYGLGRCYRKMENVGAATKYFEKFVSMTAKSQVIATQTWDPYRTAEKLEDAKQWLLETKQSP